MYGYFFLASTQKKRLGFCFFTDNNIYHLHRKIVEPQFAGTNPGLKWIKKCFSIFKFSSSIFFINLHFSTKYKNYYMTEIIFIVEEAPEGGFTAKAIDFAIFTEADTMEELRILIKDAVSCHFEIDQRPKLVRLHFVKEEILSMAS